MPQETSRGRRIGGIAPRIGRIASVRATVVRASVVLRASVGVAVLGIAFMSATAPPRAPMTTIPHGPNSCRRSASRSRPTRKSITPSARRSSCRRAAICRRPPAMRPCRRRTGRKIRKRRPPNGPTRTPSCREPVRSRRRILPWSSAGTIPPTGSAKRNTERFAGEPVRADLTDPPAGYRVPSPIPALWHCRRAKLQAERERLQHGADQRRPERRQVAGPIWRRRERWRVAIGTGAAPPSAP